jgi:hypothetical protein
VTHAGLRHTEAEAAGLRQHLGVDQETITLWQDLFEGVLAEDLQGAVAVANAGPEQCPHQVVVTPGEEPPPPRVLAGHAVADGDRLFVGEGKQ